MDVTQTAQRMAMLQAVRPLMQDAHVFVSQAEDAAVTLKCVMKVKSGSGDFQRDFVVGPPVEAAHASGAYVEALGGYRLLLDGIGERVKGIDPLLDAQIKAARESSTAMSNAATQWAARARADIGQETFKSRGRAEARLFKQLDKQTSGLHSQLTKVDQRLDDAHVSDESTQLGSDSAQRARAALAGADDEAGHLTTAFQEFLEKRRIEAAS